MATGGQTECWSKEYEEYQCFLCDAEKRVKNADKYCFDCLKFLCDRCFGIHNLLITTHQVLPLSDDTIKRIVIERCEKHPNEVIQYFCRQHNALLCTTCKEKDHKTCQDPQIIRESSDELNADPEIQAVPAQLKLALESISKAIQALDKHVAFIQTNGKRFLKYLEDFAKQLLSRIQELKEKGKMDIKNKQEDVLSVAKQQRQAFVFTKDEINQCLDKIKKSNDLKANLFVLKKKGQTMAQKVGDLYKESGNFIKGLHFHLMVDMKIFDTLSGFNSFVTEISTNDLKIRRINVRITKDKSFCGIFGCCPLNDGSLVIVDGFNRRLKYVDLSSSTVTKYSGTDGEPTDVCCIGPQEVAVAFDSTQVHVYSAVCLTRTRTIELGHKTTNIACHGGLLYCANVSNILYLHDLSSGMKLQEIFKDTDGRDLFSEIHGIALNGPGDRVYVADYMRGLVCVSTDGQRIFHLSDEDLGLSFASAVTTDHRGHVFVCGCESNNVVLVTEEGHIVGDILSGKDGIWHPRCLSYDVSRSQLYAEGDDQLLMVKFK